MATQQPQDEKSKYSQGIPENPLLFVEVNLTASWLSADKFDRALFKSGYHHTTQSLHFIVHQNCKIMIDAAILLLSFIWQLANRSVNVELEFRDTSNQSTLWYLQRVNFFLLLPSTVVVTPLHPDLQTPYIGQNTGLVELQAIPPEDPKSVGEIPGLMADRLMKAANRRNDAKKLGNTAFTIFGELIDNIFQHSQSTAPGYTALQVYPKTSKALIVIADSGIGLLNTLRSALKISAPDIYILSDMEILKKMFSEGLSRHNQDRGLGIKTCAAKTLVYQAVINVRLSTQSIYFQHLTDQEPLIDIQEDLPHIEGTQFCFDFPLDDL